MASNLYELLEVSQSASAETINANYQRLHAAYSEKAASGDNDGTNFLIALREAHSTLSNPERRKRYDEKLAIRDTEQLLADDPPLARPFFKALVIVGLIGVCGIGYAKYQAEQEKAHAERERAIAEAKIAQAQAEKKRLEEEAADKERVDKYWTQAREDMQRRQDQAYADRVSRDLQISEARARAEKQREERQHAYEEQQRVNEANRQLAAEKARLRQLEAQNRR